MWGEVGAGGGGVQECGGIGGVADDGRGAAVVVAGGGALGECGDGDGGVAVGEWWGVVGVVALGVGAGVGVEDVVAGWEVVSGAAGDVPLEGLAGACGGGAALAEFGGFSGVGVGVEVGAPSEGADDGC
ncbi:Uncharacterised protein [Dermatophilus congolensis]|uniref:Uncharacterized protein n=1 Tax=Dermatophilus congolensis TaxID=1863 RepID=A0AA46GZI2_9MICO|nr:Uncharacterised protein [Dermatophilus congolensis]